MSLISPVPPRRPLSASDESLAPPPSSHSRSCFLRRADASSSHASDGASSDTNLGLDGELPDETHGDEPAPEPEELHRQRIEKEYKPVVEQAMQDKDEVRPALLSLPVVAVR